MAMADEVREVLAGYASGGGPLLDESRLDDLGIASLDVIEIIFTLEERFAVTLPFEANDADRSGLQTVGDLIAMVARELGVDQAAA